MKLYTEEQVREAMQNIAISGFRGKLRNADDINDAIDLYINEATPIELPSEEEIDKESVERWKPLAFRGGVRWVIEHIKNQVTP